MLRGGCRFCSTRLVNAAPSCAHGEEAAADRRLRRRPQATPSRAAPADATTRDGRATDDDDGRGGSGGPVLPHLYRRRAPDGGRGHRLYLLTNTCQGLASFNSYERNSG